mmetsp:Transcript_38126/g.89139  ORF Transcript_38126/g.89139 Transcript_38126/m.89139 type:complete len:237 (-) Transcript_38126:105-815(-)
MEPNFCMERGGGAMPTGRFGALAALPSGHSICCDREGRSCRCCCGCCCCCGGCCCACSARSGCVSSRGRKEDDVFNIPLTSLGPFCRALRTLAMSTGVSTKLVRLDGGAWGFSVSRAEVVESEREAGPPISQSEGGESNFRWLLLSGEEGWGETEGSVTLTDERPSSDPATGCCCGCGCCACCCCAGCCACCGCCDCAVCRSCACRCDCGCCPSCDCCCISCWFKACRCCGVMLWS